MKKIIPFIVLLLITASCTEKKQPVSFDNIDVTIKDNWGRIYGLKLDKTGNTQVSVGGKYAKAKVEEFLINEQILDSISNVARRVDLAKIAPEYTDTCKKEDCVGYEIELKKGNTLVKTRVKNISKNPKIADLDNLVTLLYNVVRTTDLDPESLKRKEK